MRALVARSPSVGNDIAKDGEPVIPNFPVSTLGRFLGVLSGGYAYEAVVAERGDDPETWLAKLAKDYPGIPEAYLRAVLVQTLVAAATLVPGRRYRVFVTQTEATLQDVESGDLTSIWKEMNAEQYLG
jgi:hypothetical protein